MTLETYSPVPRLAAKEILVEILAESPGPYGYPGVSGENIGLHLRRLRKITGLTLEQVGAELGCTHTMVSMIERGVRECSVTDARRYVRALNSILRACQEKLHRDPLYGALTAPLA